MAVLLRTGAAASQKCVATHAPVVQIFWPLTTYFVAVANRSRPQRREVAARVRFTVADGEFQLAGGGYPADIGLLLSLSPSASGSGR